MNTVESLIIVAVAALIHASFQLSVSMLTLLSSHTIGAERSHRRLVSLTGSFTLGVFIMTLLLLSTLSLLLLGVMSSENIPFLTVMACGLLFGLGVAVWIFYYRREQGTTLWLPRGAARYLNDRTKATKHSAEAFALGLFSVVAELLFIFAPLFISALILISLAPSLQVAGVLLYAAISLFPLIIVYMMVSGGHSISRIQKWRESNKRFLQFIAGSGLLALGFYVYVERVLTPSVMAASGVAL